MLETFSFTYSPNITPLSNLLFAGRLEDVTSLYNSLKEERATMEEKLVELEDDVNLKTGDLDILKIEVVVFVFNS